MYAECVHTTHLPLQNARPYRHLSSLRTLPSYGGMLAATTTTSPRSVTRTLGGSPEPLVSLMKLTMHLVTSNSWKTPLFFHTITRRVRSMPHSSAARSAALRLANSPTTGPSNRPTFSPLRNSSMQYKPPSALPIALKMTADGRTMRSHSSAAVSLLDRYLPSAASACSFLVTLSSNSCRQRVLCQ